MLDQNSLGIVFPQFTQTLESRANEPISDRGDVCSRYVAARHDRSNPFSIVSDKGLVELIDRFQIDCSNRGHCSERQDFRVLWAHAVQPHKADRRGDGDPPMASRSAVRVDHAVVDPTLDGRLADTK